MIKRCGRCGKEQDSSFFYRDRSKHDGLSSYCRICRKAASLANHYANRDARLAYMATKRTDEDFVARVRQQQAAWYRANRTAILEEQRALYAADPAYATLKQERNQMWRTANPEAWAANCRRQNARRRARLANAYDEPVDHAAVYARDNGSCGICGEDVAWSEFHMDHIVPLSRGGRHAMTNVQTAHRSCNQRKGARLP